MTKTDKQKDEPLCKNCGHCKEWHREKPNSEGNYVNCYGECFCPGYEGVKS